MRAFPKKGPLPTGASYTSPTHRPAQQHRPHEYSVVLLGVMYPSPSAVPQRHHRTQHDRPPVPPEILINRRSTDLIFYDPIHNDDIQNPGQSRILQANAERPSASERHKKPDGTRHSSRTASIEALARDLAMLFVRERL